MGGKNSGRRAANPWVPNPQIPLWQRQPNESDLAWRGFIAYRDLGASRTTVLTTAALGKKPNYRSTLEGWSKKFGWVQRVGAWDDEQDKANRQGQLQAQRKAGSDMVKRQTAVTSAAYRMISVEFARHVHALGAANPESKPDLKKAPTVSVNDLLKLADFVFKNERHNQGEADQTIEIRDEKELSSKERDARIVHLMQAYIPTG